MAYEFISRPPNLTLLSSFVIFNFVVAKKFKFINILRLRKHFKKDFQYL